MSSHLTLDHYNLPGPVTDQQGTEQSLELDDPTAQKSKERLSLPTRRKDTDEAKARESPGRGLEGRDNRPACSAQPRDQG